MCEGENNLIIGKDITVIGSGNVVIGEGVRIKGSNNYRTQSILHSDPIVSFEIKELHKFTGRLRLDEVIAAFFTKQDLFDIIKNILEDKNKEVPVSLPNELYKEKDLKGKDDNLYLIFA